MKLMSSIAEHRDSWLCSQVGTRKFVLFDCVMLLLFSASLKGFVSLSFVFLCLILLVVKVRRGKKKQCHRSNQLPAFFLEEKQNSKSFPTVMHVHIYKNVEFMFL